MNTLISTASNVDSPAVVPSSCAPSPGVSGVFLWPVYVVLLAALLTFCDAFSHVQFNVLHYATRGRWELVIGQPTWEVFVGFCRIGLFCTAAGWAMFRKYPAPTLFRGLLSAAIFAAMYFASGVFAAHPMILFNVFLLAWALQLWTFTHDLARLVLFSALLGVLGPSFEGMISSTGVFAYNEPHIYHVPVWLSGLYLNGGLAVAATISRVERWRTGNVR